MLDQAVGSVPVELDTIPQTPGEYRIDLARIMPDEAPPFAAATDLFERAWYGDETTGPEENQRFRACAEQVVAAADRALV